MNKISIIAIVLILSIALVATARADVYIFQTQTAKLNTTGVTGNALPVTYTWYNECPSCGVYSAFSNSNNIVYYWITSNVQQLGTWHVFVGAIDSTGFNSINSVITNVIILSPANAMGNSGSSSNSLSPIILSLAPANQYNVPVEGILAFISLIFFIIALVLSFRKNGSGSMLQIGLYIVAAALMYIAISYTLLPHYPISLTSNGLTISSSVSSTNTIISPYSINTITNSNPVAEEVYIKEAIAWIYIAICMVFCLAGILSRFGNE
jgi:hypothetical protein